MPGQPFLQRESIQVPKRDNRRAFNYDGARGAVGVVVVAIAVTLNPNAPGNRAGSE